MQLLYHLLQLIRAPVSFTVCLIDMPHVGVLINTGVSPVQTACVSEEGPGESL